MFSFFLYFCKINIIRETELNYSIIMPMYEMTIQALERYNFQVLEDRLEALEKKLAKLNKAVVS